MIHQLGASRIATIFGLDNFCSPVQLWEEMVHGKKREQNDDMLRGIHLEDGLVNWWTHLERAKDVQKRVVIAFPEDKRLGVTLDAAATVGAEAVVVEAKCPRSASKKVAEEKGGGWEKVWSDRDGLYPFKYHLQVVFQLGVAEAAGAHYDYGVLIAGPLWGDLYRFRIQPDPRFFVTMVTKAQQFLHFVETKTPLTDAWSVQQRLAVAS